MKKKHSLLNLTSFIFEKRIYGGSIFVVEKYKVFRFTILRRIKSNSGIQITICKFFSFSKPLTAIEAALRVEDRDFGAVDIPVDWDYNPLVSVIVPNYNHGKYLRQRLDSIYQQTYKKIEVILLDDASSDDSVSILEEYAEKYSDCTRLFINKNNSGKVFHQWNKGLGLAHGEYVWIAESDDYCDRNFLWEVLQGLKHQSVMLSFARSVFVEDGKKIWSQEEYLRDLPIMWNTPFVMTAHTLVNKAFAVKNIVPNVSSAVFRNIGIIPKEITNIWATMSLCGDWLFYLWMIRGGAVSYTCRVNNYYRIHPKSTSLKIQKTLNYYVETHQISCFVAQHYDVDLPVFETVKKNLIQHYRELHKNENTSEVEKVYNFDVLRKCAERRKANVVMCGYALTQGGGEIFPIYLANELKRQGLSVTFIEFRGAVRDEEIRKKLDKSIPLIQLSSVLYLKGALVSLGAEIIHSHEGNTDSAVACAIKNRDQKCKHIITLHGMYEAISKKELDCILSHVLYSCSCFVYIADKNIAPFENILKSVNLHKIGNGLPKIHVIPQSRKELGIEENAFCLTLASRALPEKGWMEAVEAVKGVSNKSKRPIHLLLIGDGECFDKLRAMKLPSYIHLLGRKSDVRSYFAMSDVGLLPSRFKGESFPLVVIESLMCGIPVIASDVGEIRNMITDETGDMAGVLFRLMDWEIPVDDLEKIILELLDEKKYLQVKMHVQNVVGKFDITYTANQYINVYNDALGKVLNDQLS